MIPVSPSTALFFADVILAMHGVIIAFNVLGLVLIPWGAWRSWKWVRRPFWRLAHLFALSIVALQALLGRACFLTLWQDHWLALAGLQTSHQPLIQGWINRLLFWPLPMAFFVTLYVLVWGYVIWLWYQVPPRWHR